MKMSSRAGLVGLLAGTLLAAMPTGVVAAPTVLAIAPFGYVDTSGEVRDQTAAHRERIEALAAALGRDLVRDSHFTVVPVRENESGKALLAEASRADADLLVAGNVHKMSTLIQWAEVFVVDVRSGRQLARKLLTFRGDNAAAWDHAERFLVRDLLNGPLKD